MGEAKRRKETVGPSGLRVAEVVIPLVLPYHYKAPEDKLLRDVQTRQRLADQEADTAGRPRLPVRTYDEIRRDCTERFIAEAVAAVYEAERCQRCGTPVKSGGEMPRDARRLYRPIQEQLIDEIAELRVSRSEFRWFWDTCTSPKVKVRPSDTTWHEQWLEALEVVKKDVDELPAPESSPEAPKG